MKILARKMITNVQILTDDGGVTAVVDQEKKISAAHQNMRTIPNILFENFGQWVEVLDLSYNKLRNLSSLKAMPNLNTLILDHNLITSTTLFPKLPSLKVLWINFNLISDIGLFVPPLSRSCPFLQHLSLMGNVAAPITLRGSADNDQKNYRRFVILHFEHLRHLDDKPVTAIERLRSTVAETPTFVDNVQNYLNDVKSSIVLKFGRNFNSIV